MRQPQHAIRPAVLLLSAFAICVVGSAWGQSPDQASASGSAVVTLDSAEGQPQSGGIKMLPTEVTSPREAADKIRTALKQHVQFDLQDVLLASFRELLEKELKCNVMLDVQELQTAGIDPDTTLITAVFKDIPCDLALRHILPASDMGYYIDGPLLILTTKDMADTILETRVYDCEDLLLADRAFLESIAPKHSAPQPAPVQGDAGTVAKPVSQIGVGGGEFIPARKEVSPETRFIDVITAVTGTANGQGWLDEGTGAGTIAVFAGKLVVSQTWQVHDELEALLAMMREQLGTTSAERTASLVK